MRKQHGAMAVVVGAALGAAACGDRSMSTAPVPQVSRAEILQALTPEAAAAVGSDGRLPAPQPLETGRPQLAVATAESLAVAVARRNLPYDRERLDREHGGPIAYRWMIPCGRTAYAAPAFERLAGDDPATAAWPEQKAFGPWWLVTLCAPGGEPQLSVAVSAYATELRVTADGSIEFPAIGGNDFLPLGIPRGRAADELPTAEAAAVLAAKLSGRRVAAAPELVAPYYREDAPQGARWRVRLDGPARILTAGGSAAVVTEVYVSRVPRRGASRERTWAAAASQPAAVEMVLTPPARVGENLNDYLRRKQAEARTVSVARRPAVPIIFDAGAFAP